MHLFASNRLKPEIPYYDEFSRLAASQLAASLTRDHRITLTQARKHLEDRYGEQPALFGLTVKQTVACFRAAQHCLLVKKWERRRRKRTAEQKSVEERIVERLYRPLLNINEWRDVIYGRANSWGAVVIRRGEEPAVKFTPSVSGRHRFDTHDPPHAEITVPRGWLYQVDRKPVVPLVCMYKSQKNCLLLSSRPYEEADELLEEFHLHNIVRLTQVRVLRRLQADREVSVELVRLQADGPHSMDIAVFESDVRQTLHGYVDRVRLSILSRLQR